MTTVIKTFADLVSRPPSTLHPTHRVSSSSRIKEWMLDADRPSVFNITSKELASKLGVTFGAASGFMSKLVMHDAAEKIGRRDGAVLYRVEKALVDNVKTRLIPTNGSVKGGTKNSHRMKTAGLPDMGAIKGYDLVNALLEAAAFAETLIPSLADFSTKELIDELHRRTHAGDRVNG